LSRSQADDSIFFFVARLLRPWGIAMTKEQEEQNFRVTDKRAFKEDGTPTDSEPSESAGEKPGSQSTSEAKTESSAQEVPPRPPIDFPSYILSYYTQGLVLLGEVPNPYTNKKEEDVDAARHILDILSMLQEKTRGNLRKEEEQLLDGVLYELRMKFMAKTNKIKL
jgi:hypothetical protein